MHTVPQNNHKFTINNISNCCETLIFTQPLVHKFLCGLIFMGHRVEQNSSDMQNFRISVKAAISLKNLGTV